MKLPAHPRVVTRSSPAADSGGAEARATGKRAALSWLTDNVGLDENQRPHRSSSIWPPRTPALGACRRTTRSCSSVSSTKPAACSSSCIRRYGSRINRAWGLALRKRFCRKFNFELQAAATEDGIVLSLTTAHSFELVEVARYLHSTSVREVLIQALLDAPMFTTRWRWTASVALALPRFRGGRKVPPQLARMKAEDLLAAIFPEQVACAENLAGARGARSSPGRQTLPTA